MGIFEIDLIGANRSFNIQKEVHYGYDLEFKE